MVHALKALRPYLLNKPFELHTDNASLQWLQQHCLVSHHQARWLNLLAKFQYRVVHIPGRTKPADFLTRKRFSDCPGPALHTGYDEPDSVLELFSAAGGAPAAAFVTAGLAAEAPYFLHADFAAKIRAALPSEPVLGPLAAAAPAPAPCAADGTADASGAPRHFAYRDGLLYSRSTRGDRLCVPAAGALRVTVQVLRKLHATPLDGLFGRDKTLALARHSVW